VFGNNVLRQIFAFWDWRIPYNVELHDLYFSKNYIFVTRTRTMTLTVHVARMEERRDAYRVLSGKSERKGHLENLNLGLRNLLNMNYQEIGLGFGLD
jgi:hypothetical protein